MSYGSAYIDIPNLRPGRVGRTLNKMSNNKSTASEAPKAPEFAKPSKAKYSKTRGEHFKDLVIVMLVTGIIAFVGGVVFQNKQQNAINTAVKGAQTVAQPEVKK